MVSSGAVTLYNLLIFNGLWFIIIMSLFLVTFHNNNAEGQVCLPSVVSVLWLIRQTFAIYYCSIAHFKLSCATTYRDLQCKSYSKQWFALHAVVVLVAVGQFLGKALSALIATKAT